MKIENLAQNKVINPFSSKSTTVKKPKVVRTKKEVYKLDVTDFVNQGQTVVKSLDHMKEKIEKLDLSLTEEKKKFLEDVKERFDTKDQELALYKESKITPKDFILVIKLVTVAQVSMAVVIVVAILLR